MIKIDRGAIPADLEIYTQKKFKGLDGITLITKAEQEFEKAIAFFDNPLNYAGDVKLTDKKFTFAVYKDPALALALEKVLGPKCVYCESRFAHVTPREIEHFRPKSEIITSTDTLSPGYYWLAGEWDNLLISCVDCNRSRAHEVPGQPAKVKLGKGAQFPLSNEAKRRRRSGSLVAEEKVRLLLNPCLDEPREHLFFADNGLVFPIIHDHGTPSQKAEFSIAAYALQRKLLVEERLRVLNSLRFHLDQLSFLVRNHNTLTSRGASAIELADNSNQIRRVKDELRLMLSPTAPYLAMLRDWLRTARGRGDFDQLLQFGIDPVDLI